MWLDEDEKLAELISATRKDWEAFMRWTLARAWGVYSVFILEDVASDKALRRDLLFPLVVPL